ncbi:MAG TPA: group II intron maturase-specific domain-containing protein [Chloroflexota bacterium]|nr:group II intron maturase-specific domain-containing protein [Chloroflexota bacterium]
MIAELNPIIRGWTRYYATVVSKEIFAALDAWLFALLLRWARRRHPNKGAAWLGRRRRRRARGSARFVIWEPAFDTTCASHRRTKEPLRQRLILASAIEGVSPTATSSPAGCQLALRTGC